MLLRPTLKILAASLSIALLSGSLALAQTPPAPPPPPEGDEPPQPTLPTTPGQPAATPTTPTTPTTPMTPATPVATQNAATPSAGQPASSTDPTSPVVRAEAGNWGMFFRFGGLATMTHVGESQAVAAGALLTMVGMKPVINANWRIPFYFGAVVRVTKPDVADAVADYGLRVGAGFEYHFRTWRRISPFVGGGFTFGVVDPAGPNNWRFGFGFGPTLGVEYYIGDRVSLTAQYLFALDFELQSGAFVFTMATASGGALTVTYYF